MGFSNSGLQLSATTSTAARKLAYGRGLAKRKKGDTAAGKADMAAAIAIDPNIASDFARYGAQIGDLRFVGLQRR